MPRILPAVLGLFLTATAAHGQVPPVLTLKLIPAAPTTDDWVRLQVTVNVGLIALETYSRGEHSFDFGFQDHCLVLCPPDNPSLVEIPLGRLEAGDWSIHADLDNDPSTSITLEFEVLPIPLDRGRANLVVQPAIPTAADPTSLQVPYETAPCQERPSIGRVERAGDHVAVYLALDRPDETCTDVQRELGSLFVELGQLEPGDYQLELWGEDPLDPPLEPLLLDSVFVTIAPAAQVTLLGRYRAGLTWRTRDGLIGTAEPVAGGSNESALFSFFTPANWEVMVKVLDGCAINGNRWVFLAAATDVEFTLTVEDLEGAAPPYTYTSPAGLAPPLADTAAFACTP